MAISNAEFGRRTGYHWSMASRMLAGNRVPSVDGMRRISEAFNIPIEELMDAHAEGAAHFGPWLRERIDSMESSDEAVEKAAKATGTVEEKLAAGKK